jgi:phosphatidylinositol alpha-1,6-mannosyltransferase
MRLLVVTHNFPPQVGGIENLCLALCRALVRAGASVEVVAKAQPEGPSGDEAARRFDAGEPFRVQRYRHADLGQARAIERVLRNPVDHAICMQWTSASWLSLRRLATRAPRSLAIVSHGKEITDEPLGPVPVPIRTFVQRVTLERATQIWPVSEFTAARVRMHAPGARVHVLHPGVDLERYRPSAPERVRALRGSRSGPIILSVGRLVKRKGFDTLLRSLPLMAATVPDVRCWIAGEGPERERLDQLARELGVAGRVEFLGRVPDAEMRDLYSAADLFTLLSRSEARGQDVEGFGMVLLEAQACGTPVATTREGGMPDALIEGVTGLLVDPHDPSDFAQQAGALLQDASRVRAMSEAALQHAHEQHWDNRAAQALGWLAEP